MINARNVLAQMLGRAARERARHHRSSSARGSAASSCRGRTAPLAAAAARQLGKPVKLVLSRKMMFQTVGHRPRTQQRVRLGATTDGKLVSLQHDYVNHTSILDDYDEDCGEATPSSTACRTCG